MRKWRLSDLRNLFKDTQLIGIDSGSVRSQIPALEHMESSVGLASEAEARLGKPPMSYKEDLSFW